jgi:sugar/nucleoside kinase (ribokinase family)
MYDICCIGHITSDKIVTPGSVVYMSGGTAFYFSNALQHMHMHYLLVTAVAPREKNYVTALQEKNIEVLLLPTTHTVCFENIYPANQDHRVQKVSQKADPFDVDQLNAVAAKVFHLGPLLADDMSVDLIHNLSLRGKVSLDVQGFLREVSGDDVQAIDWAEKKQALAHIHFLKANEAEMEMLTGLTDVHQAAEVLAEWGVKEVIITLGSKGSVIYTGNEFYTIPAYPPVAVVDATGCGDTYMAGYLYQRNKGAGYQQAGEFAAAMATIKIQSSGPFTGNEKDVQQLLAKYTQIVT